jgi:hypothetical protein
MSSYEYDEACIQAFLEKQKVEDINELIGVVK